ncbi:hypothetical protein FRC98_01285 [Lujinxingia vulgaris]|uniref:DUF4382 domain-containing protein n=1 Tax=Lujinxingia vulgaris TaxID=2600176 RepID=A0A5C6XAZ3_9DELT|nr:hypothetical protein [Lujinxingia vulgaris]TXD39067.1 hypothetical protein FRC98_01285 [Lujinxingia vulgaris]
MQYRIILLTLALAITPLSACGGSEHDHSHHEDEAHDDHEEDVESDRLTITEPDSGEVLVVASTGHLHGELPPVAEEQSLTVALDFADSEENPLDLSGNLHAELRFADGAPEDILELGLDDNLLTLTSIKRGQTSFHVQLFEDDTLRFESPALFARVVTLGEEHVHDHGDISRVDIINADDDTLITSIEGDAYSGDPLQLSAGESLTVKVLYIGESDAPMEMGDHVVLPVLADASAEDVVEWSVDVETVTLTALAPGEVQVVLELNYFGMSMHTPAALPIVVSAD